MLHIFCYGAVPFLRDAATKTQETSHNSKTPALRDSVPPALELDFSDGQNV